LLTLLGSGAGLYYQINAIKKISHLETDQEKITDTVIMESKKSPTTKNADETVQCAVYGIASNGTQNRKSGVYVTTNGYGEKPFNYNAAFFTNK
jgi:formylmethanofuran dehydrogenase subunit B